MIVVLHGESDFGRIGRYPVSASEVEHLVTHIGVVIFNQGFHRIIEYLRREGIKRIKQELKKNADPRNIRKEVVYETSFCNCRADWNFVPCSYDAKVIPTVRMRIKVDIHMFVFCE